MPTDSRATVLEFRTPARRTATTALTPVGTGRPYIPVVQHACAVADPAFYTGVAEAGAATDRGTVLPFRRHRPVRRPALVQPDRYDSLPPPA